MIACLFVIVLLLSLIMMMDERLSPEGAVLHFVIAMILVVAVAFFIALFVYLLTPVLTGGA